MKIHNLKLFLSIQTVTKIDFDIDYLKKETSQTFEHKKGGLIRPPFYFKLKYF